VAEGSVVSITKFGAFVQLAEGIEGMIHVSDMSAEKRVNHPQDMLKVGQSVKAQVLELDAEKRRLKLGMKQLVPTSIDEYLAEHNEGDVVSGRIMEVSSGSVPVELGEGIHATCRLSTDKVKQESSGANQSTGTKADLASLTSMLQARWKGGATAKSDEPQELQSGQIRSFRIKKLDRATKKVEVELT
jgi:small subunit ribosomal protein S1